MECVRRSAGDGVLIESGGPYTEALTQYETKFSVPAVGTYMFNITDPDGLYTCETCSNGGYSIIVDGHFGYFGSQFVKYELLTFGLPLDSPYYPPRCTDDPDYVMEGFDVVTCAHIASRSYIDCHWYLEWGDVDTEGYAKLLYSCPIACPESEPY
eukprot:1593122-Pleurochrysis_carterae.AAC.3